MSVQKSITMTATQARASFFDILNKVQYFGDQVIIVRNGQEVARIVSPEPSVDLKKYKEKILKVTPFMSEEDAETISKLRAENELTRDPNW